MSKKQSIHVFHYLGNCKSLSINVKADNVKITDISLNKKIPFQINYVRLIIIISIYLIIFSIKNNLFWKVPYNYRNSKQNLVLMLIIDLGILVIFFYNNGCSNPQIKDLYNDNLVKALSKGQVEISNTPDNTKLEDLDNPYDTIERSKLERDIDYIWDSAYYNQRYYVYFGALPALLLMVPYYLITKKLMQSATVVLLFSLISVPVLVILIKRIFQKYFKELPFVYLALSALIMIFGTMLIWINVAPRFYELVTVAGFFFAILGFLLIISCEKEDGSVSYKKMFLGCLSLASAVACRPTQLFASFLIVPFLLKIFIKNVKEKKNIIKNIFVVAIPYITIAGFIMRYNYLRFGSVFEFGEKYQLTINNIKELKLRWSLLPTGILCNLFGLPTFQGFFPFIHTNGNIIDTFAYYYVEDMPGGIFMISPIAFGSIAFFKRNKNFKNQDLKNLIISLIIVGTIFVTFISLKAGSTGRYLLDYAWIFVLAGILVFMENYRNLKTEEGKRIFGKIFKFIFCYTIIINVLLGFCIIGGNNSMKNNLPKQYFDAEYTIMILK